MKAQFLHISLDIKEDINVNALVKTLDLAVDWVKYQPTCWIVRTTSDAGKWYARLSPFLGDNDSMLIVKIDLTNKAARLPDFVIEWIDGYFPEQFPVPPSYTK